MDYIEVEGGRTCKGRKKERKGKSSVHCRQAAVGPLENEDRQRWRKSDLDLHQSLPFQEHIWRETASTRWGSGEWKDPPNSRSCHIFLFLWKMHAQHIIKEEMICCDSVSEVLVYSSLASLFLGMWWDYIIMEDMAEESWPSHDDQDVEMWG